MRIAVASDDGVTLAAHTGRCGGFVVFDIADGVATRREYRPNTFTGHARGECEGGHQSGADHAHQSHGPLLEAIGDCGALLSRGMGPRLRVDLAAHNIEACVTAVAQLEQAAEQFAAGQLQRTPDGGACPQG